MKVPPPPALSTPHGALGTKRPREESFKRKRLSTPHGALGTKRPREESFKRKRLSTPHGALGTCPEELQDVPCGSFNSTRCIRNAQTPAVPHPQIPYLSTPHGALGT